MLWEWVISGISLSLRAFPVCVLFLTQFFRESVEIGVCSELVSGLNYAVIGQR